MDTQNKKILAHLEKYGSITPIEAQELYRCMRLASRIADLRGMKYKITTERVKSANGAWYAKYRLVESEEQK